MTIPQISNVWLARDASGVSLASWTAYTGIAGFWLFWGILHREKPIMFVNSLAVIANSLLVIGLLMYR